MELSAKLQELELALSNKSTLVSKLEADLTKMNASIPRTKSEDLESLLLGKPQLDESATSDIVPILKSQRDRFRQKNEELEDVLSV